MESVDRQAKKWPVIAAVFSFLLAFACTSDPQPEPSARAHEAPAQEISYEVRPSRPYPGSKLVGVLRNKGPSVIEYGQPFKIERLGDSGWKQADPGPRCGFEDVGYSLNPGDFDQQRIGWLGRSCSYERLSPGRYRVTKEVWKEGDNPLDEVIRVRATFTVARR
jgi:hypothetical protein